MARRFGTDRLFAGLMAMLLAAGSAGAADEGHALGAGGEAPRIAVAKFDYEDTSGEVRLDGLDGPVEILRDGNGIPQVYADTSSDLFFAQGFVTAQDPENPDIVWSESQGGNMGRSNLKTGERDSFDRPDWRTAYRDYQDSIALLWPDITEPMPGQHRDRDADRARGSPGSAGRRTHRSRRTRPHGPDGARGSWCRG